MASYVMAGEKAGDLDTEGVGMLRQWFADMGWCDLEDDGEDGQP